MNTTITKSQEKKLSAYLNELKEDGGLVNVEDRLLDVFLPVKKGIEVNGMEAKEIAIKLRVNPNNYKQFAYFRTHLCQFQKMLVEEGYPFGGLKVGKYKKYGWTTSNEWLRLSQSRKRRLAGEIHAGLLYIDEQDELIAPSKKFLIEYDKQQKLFEE